MVNTIVNKMGVHLRSTMSALRLNQKPKILGRQFHSFCEVQDKYYLSNKHANNNIQTVCLFGDGRGLIMDNLESLKRSMKENIDNDGKNQHTDEIIIRASNVENSSDIIRMHYNKTRNHLSDLHLSARYEHFKETEDPSVQDYITGKQINAATVDKPAYYEQRLDSLIDKFEIRNLLAKNLIELSNGQFRRVEYVKQLMRSPKVLMINDPFIGIDPFNLNIISKNLKWEVENNHMCLVLGLRNLNDSIPDWCDSRKNKSSLKFKTEIKDGKLSMKLLKDESSHRIKTQNSSVYSSNCHDGYELKKLINEKGKRIADTIWQLKKSASGSLMKNQTDSHIKFDRFDLEYNMYQKDSPHARKLPVFKDLSFDIKFGEKCQIKGFNGTGKSTLLSLITLEHPKSYSSKIRYMDIPNKKHNYFDLSSTIALSSPELHLIFPKYLSVFQCITLGFNLTNNDFKIPKFIKEEKGFTIDKKANNIAVKADAVSSQETTNLEILKFLIDEFENYFKIKKICIFDKKFVDLSLCDQKLVLFIKSLLKVPDLLILDESFSSMLNTEGGTKHSHDKHLQADLMVLDIVISVTNHYKGTVLYVTHDEANEMVRCDKFVNLMGVDKFSVGRYKYGEGSERKEVDVKTYEHGELVKQSA